MVTINNNDNNSRYHLDPRHETPADAPTIPHAVCVSRKSVAPTSFLFSHHSHAGDDGGGTGVGDGHRVRGLSLYCFAFAQIRAEAIGEEYASCSFRYVVYFLSLLWH